MGIFEIIFIAFGLSMDIFAVSICKGLAMKKIDFKKLLIISICFCAFHIGMLLIGYFLGGLFSDFVEKVDHYIACILLTIIGGSMIKEAILGKKENEEDKLDFKSMIMLSIATSIDALTIGVTFAFFEVNIVFASCIIGVVTLIMSALGVIIGNKFGNKLENKAQVIGGIILILIGIKILLEHLGILVL